MCICGVITTFAALHSNFMKGRALTCAFMLHAHQLKFADLVPLFRVSEAVFFPLHSHNIMTVRK